MNDRILYVAINGGLCNRLRALCCCLTVSEIAKLKKTEMIWFKNSSCNMNFTDFFVHRDKEFNPQLSFNTGPADDFQWSMFGEEDIVSTVVVNTNLPSFGLATKLNKFFDFKLDRKTFSEHYDRVVKEQIVLRQTIKKKVRKFVEYKNIEECIGLQIRDNIDWRLQWDNRKGTRKRSLRSFKDVMLNNEKKKFFICTDSEQTETEFLEFARLKGIKAFGRSKNWTSEKSYRRNARATPMEDAVIDLFSLSYCEELYISHRSSFGGFSKSLTKEKKTTIIY